MSNVLSYFLTGRDFHLADEMMRASKVYFSGKDHEEKEMQGRVACHFHAALAQHNMILNINPKVTIQPGFKAIWRRDESVLAPSIEYGNSVTLTFDTEAQALMFKLSHSGE